MMSRAKKLKLNEKEEEYIKEYERSITNPIEYWKNESKRINWIENFAETFSGKLEDGDVKWFKGGKSNVSFNCIDRHIEQRGDETAIIWEGDDPVKPRKMTFKELHEKVCRLANLLKKENVKKGDVVCIYMPMIPEAAVAMLACARIGAIHSVVFGGFSAQALSERISHSECKVLITADKGIRGGKVKNLLEVARKAREKANSAQTKILAFYRESAVEENDEIKIIENEVNASLEMENQSKECAVEPMDSEDTLFLLYTSGSTGKPKALLHTTGGYQVYAAATVARIFDARPGDIFGCVADVGWITGHTYVVYGPLLNGVTTFMFESTPFYPDFSRYWKIIQNHKLTQFYTSPTALRAVQRKMAIEKTLNFDTSSLRVIGSVGEPIGEKTWEWYSKAFGGQKTSLVDTYWQTETGGIIVSPQPQTGRPKPSSAWKPFFGIEAVVLDPITGQKANVGEKGVLCVRRPWPGVSRTIFKDHQAYLKTYMEPYPGYYYTGDGAMVDKDGDLFITGRVDDVISIAGHRIGTAEIEAAISSHSSVAECAVVGVPDKIRGEQWLAFAVPNVNVEEIPAQTIRLVVREKVGAFAAIGDALVVKDLPKTRSGKVMRRILRKIVAGEEESLGDLSTIQNQSVVGEIIKAVKNMAELKAQIGKK